MDRLRANNGPFQACLKGTLANKKGSLSLLYVQVCACVLCEVGKKISLGLSACKCVECAIFASASRSFIPSLFFFSLSKSHSLHFRPNRQYHMEPSLLRVLLHSLGGVCVTTTGTCVERERGVPFRSIWIAGYWRQSFERAFSSFLSPF